MEWCNELRMWGRSRPGRKGKRLSKRTRQLEETALRSLLYLAVQERWIVANPMRALKRIKAKKPNVEWLEPKEAVRLLDAAREMDGKTPSLRRTLYRDVAGHVSLDGRSKERGVWVAGQ